MPSMDRVRLTYDGDLHTAKVELITVGDDGVTTSTALIPAEQAHFHVDAMANDGAGACALVLRIDGQFVTMVAEGKTDPHRIQSMQHLCELRESRQAREQYERKQAKASEDAATVKLCAHHQKLGECSYGCIDDDPPTAPITPKRNSKKRT